MAQEPTPGPWLAQQPVSHILPHQPAQVRHSRITAKTTLHIAVISAVTPTAWASASHRRYSSAAPGAEKLCGAASEIEAQQGDHPGEADDQPREPAPGR